VHEVTAAAELLDREEEVVYGDAGYQGLDQRWVRQWSVVSPWDGINAANGPTARMIGCGNGVNVPKPHLRARVEQAFRIMKQQSGFDKTRLRGMGKNDSKVLILSAIDQLLHREESSVVDAGGIGSGCSDTKSSYN